MLSPSYQRARELALVALFTALTIALGAVYVPLPFLSPVPITGQSMGAMLAGGVLGARKGFLSQLLMVLLVAVGLPVLAGGRGGLGVLQGPSGGYIVAWPFAALLIGWLAERVPTTSRVSLPLLLGIMGLGGLGLVYAIGVPWLSLVSGQPLPQAIAVGLLPFVPGDLLKAVAAGFAVRAVWLGYDPRLPARAANAVSPSV